jgi:hypothetical protein
MIHDECGKYVWAITSKSKSSSATSSNLPSFNMAATKTTTVDSKRSIICLTANGSNVRSWETALHRLLQMHSMTCLLLADYGMFVSASKTLALDLEMQAEKVIKASHAKVVAEARFVSAESTVAKAHKVKMEALEAGTMPKLEKVTPGGPDDTKEKVEVVEVNDVATRTEHKMRARVKLMAARMHAQALTTQRRGAQHTVFFLDPLSALELHDADLKESVCHVHTLYDETMRYAVESSENAQVRMMIDDIITRSLSAIPAHVTTGVVSGNIHDRFQRVVLYFDDIGRQALIEQIDTDLSLITKRERESFAAFTSRFKDIEFRMEEQRMTTDPELMMSKLERAITSSSDQGVRNALGQVKLAISIPTSTTAELLAAMAGPMRAFEKEHKAAGEKVKAAQETVNALHVGQRGGKGGRGRGGGRGGKGGGGGGGRGNCLKFAEGTCSNNTSCIFNHVSLNAKEIAELKAKLTKSKAAKAFSRQRKGGHTAAQVVNALKTAPGTTPAKSLAEKMEELRTSGLTDEQIIKVASVLLENQ